MFSKKKSRDSQKSQIPLNIKTKSFDSNILLIDSFVFYAISPILQPIFGG